MSSSREPNHNERNHSFPHTRTAPRHALYAYARKSTPAGRACPHQVHNVFPPSDLLGRLLLHRFLVRRPPDYIDSWSLAECYFVLRLSWWANSLSRIPTTRSAR